MVNGGKTPKLNVKRGVRQGSPYSMLLFVVSTMPLINMINNDESINGHTTTKNNTITRSTQRAQTSLAEADNYSHIAHCKNVEPWL